jgi:hypothetical protein
LAEKISQNRQEKLHSKAQVEDTLKSSTSSKEDMLKSSTSSKEDALKSSRRDWK